MVNQILHGCPRIARHRLPRSLDEPVIALFRARNCLRSRFGRWFRHAGQYRFGEGVHQRKERLLAPSDAENIVRNAIKACYHPFLGADQFGSSVKFAADCGPNERAGTCVTPGLRRLLDLTLLLSGKPDRDSGISGSTRGLPHKKPYAYKGSKRHFWDNFFAAICVEHRSNTRRILSHKGSYWRRSLCDSENTDAFDKPFMFHYQSFLLIFRLTSTRLVPEPSIPVMYVVFC
jgi:hypothetical protein